MRARLPAYLDGVSAEFADENTLLFEICSAMLCMPVGARRASLRPPRFQGRWMAGSSKLS